MLGTALWYLKRLSVMSPAEVMHRAGEAWAVRRLRRGHAHSKGAWRELDSADFGFSAAVAPQLPALSWDADFSPAEAKRLLAGEWQALAFGWQWRAETAVWHRAPDTGSLWPQAFFADIRYREGNPVGDVRVAWEPARLQQLVSLALLAERGESAGASAVALAEDVLVSWVAANPPYVGIHYISAMECALRLIAVCHALDLLRGRLMRPEDTWGAALRLIASHAPLIAKRLSLYSSAGNHTIAEAVGLLYAGILFPEFADANHWQATGLRLLEHEAPRQILPDGGGIEQAFWYQLFIVDLLGLAKALLEHRSLDVPAAIKDAVRRGREFLRAIADGPSHLPAIGDSDNGYALSRHLRISWSRPLPEQRRVVTFRDSGYTMLRGSSPVPYRALFDHGSMGMRPACGHGHADALSVHLTVCGEEILIDPGTFTYTGDQEWRRWFRGTAAHNTVCLDHADQAKQETAFQWSSCHAASLVWVETGPDDTVAVLACHNGYARLGVTHWRGLISGPGIDLAIWDLLEGQGEHLAELHWHCAGEWVQWPDGVLSRDGGAKIKIRIAGGEIGIHHGEVSPPRGWRSGVYGERTPATTARVKYRGTLPHEFLTCVSVDGSDSVTTAAAWRVHIDRFRARVAERSGAVRGPLHSGI